MSTTYFITGTDTEVGKTYICARLLNAFRGDAIIDIRFKAYCIRYSTS
jgi:dethiobiotin synthetase